MTLEPEEIHYRNTKADQAELNEHIKKYLKDGGKITKLKSGFPKGNYHGWCSDQKSKYMTRGVLKCLTKKEKKAK